MNKLSLFILLFFGVQVYDCAANKEKTEALHAEAKEHKNPNITQETHPVLYEMIKDLVTKANIEMPKYISLYSAEHSVVTRNGTVYKTASDITAWTDTLGDLHICNEILTDLSYEDVKGILAVAIAEKAKGKPGRLALVAVSTFAGTVAFLYYLSKYHNLDVKSLMFGNRYDCYHQRQDNFEGFIWLMLAPACLTTKLASNNLQKDIDIEATQLVDSEHVINGLKNLDKLQETYTKEGFFSRLASALKLKTIYNTIFYPVRSFTTEERVFYLEQLTAAQ